KRALWLLKAIRCLSRYAIKRAFIYGDSFNGGYLAANWPQRLILAAITLPIDEALEGQAAVARRILRHC
ncbi:MAG: hypothetical protein AAGC59_17690, partial [Brucella pseudogrignonensis]